MGILNSLSRSTSPRFLSRYPGNMRLHAQTSAGFLLRISETMHLTSMNGQWRKPIYCRYMKPLSWDFPVVYPSFVLSPCIGFSVFLCPAFLRSAAVLHPSPFFRKAFFYFTIIFAMVANFQLYVYNKSTYERRNFYTYEKFKSKFVSSTTFIRSGAYDMAI